MEDVLDSEDVDWLEAPEDRDHVDKLIAEGGKVSTELSLSIIEKKHGSYDCLELVLSKKEARRKESTNRGRRE